MMKNVNRSSLSEIKIETGDLMPLEEQYRSALSQISQIVTVST